MDYKSKRWERKRKHILVRDGWTDQYLLRQGIKVEARLVHHILPAEIYPEYQWEDWNLISISDTTHRHLHEKYSGGLSPDGWELARETADAQGVKLEEVILVVGLPGTGKTTWAREHIGGGIAYDLDEIASAFRLGEDQTAGSRRMAASMRQAWIASAAGYASRIIVIRTAPNYEELSETDPDRVIVCTKQWAKRGFSIDEATDTQRIRDVVEWAEANSIAIEYYPKK